MSIRLRLALVFGLLTALVLSLGGYFFVVGLSSRLTGLLDAQLTAQLDQVSRNVVVGPGAAEAGNAPSTAGPAAGEYFYQLLDESGRVRGASSDAGPGPLLDRQELQLAKASQRYFTKQIEGEHARVAAAPYRARPGWVEVAGASLESIDRTLREVGLELALGGAGGLIVAFAGAYLLARASLRPVERMRREVARLSDRARPATIDVPGTHDEIAALARTMNELLERLQRSLARQRSFVADAAHELRTPFAVMHAELELAGRPGRSAQELAAALSGAAEETARLTRLTEDLLVLARSDEDQLALRRQETDIATLLEQSVERARVIASRTGVTLRLDVTSGLRAELDRARIRQAVDNLLNNALRFAPSRSEIVVAARVTGADLTVSVSDTGPGFPPEFLSHAFERFRRPDSGRSRSDGGTGLGLAIVEAVVKAHGGRVEASNRPTGGAEVVIRLPLRSSDEAVDEARGGADLG